MKTENFFGNTDTGRQRTNNEDAFIAQQLADGQVLACVIDGVGGYEGGEVAAAIAHDTIIEKVKSGSEDPILQMKQSILQSNDRIYAERTKDPEKGSMACVLTMALADPENNQLYYAHVGDTRLYLFRDHSLVKLTRDHSFVGFLEDNKKLTEEEAMKHPKRNEVNKALGFDPNIATVADYIETGISPFLPGDLLLLCSDGLSDLVDNRAMTAILSSSQSLRQKTNALINAANEAGGKDNITVVLVQNNKKPLKQKAMKPTLVKKKHAPDKITRAIENPPTNVNSNAGTETTDWATSVMTRSRSRRENFLVIAVFSLLLITLSLAAVIFYLFLNKSGKETIIDQPSTPVQLVPNSSVLQLADSINRSGTIYLEDSLSGKSIIINDTIFIGRDSLHIIGNGATLRADSLYKGPAFFIGRNCKYIMLENIVFSDFTKGIIAENGSLRMKNIRFVNCSLPVQYNFLLPSNSWISGNITDTVLFKEDSLPKK